MQFELWDSDDVPVPRKELLQKVKGVDALLCVLTEKIDAELLDAAGLRTAHAQRKLISHTFNTHECSGCSSRSEPEGPKHHVCGL